MNRRVLIAPNAFKGTLSASEAAEIIAQTISNHSSGIDIQICPIADGGDGTCELISDFLKLERRSIWTLDSVGRPVMAKYGLDRKAKAAYIDVSSASGLGALEQSLQNPRNTSTFGTGKLIEGAISEGCETIILGLGGSATIDLGLGILQNLGLTFLNENGREIAPYSPDFLSRIAHIQIKHPLPKIEIICLCDVNNTFFGAEGAIPVFGKQKGLSENDFMEYEENCRKVVNLLMKKVKEPVLDQPGFGAAGGIAYGLSHFFDVKIEAGAKYFFDAVNIKDLIQESDLVITGEGRFDMQSAKGKGPFELKKLCEALAKDCLLISSGRAGKDAGFQYFVQLEDLDLSDVKANELAKKNLATALRVFLSEWA